MSGGDHNSRSSRASARTGAAWGSIKALSNFDNTVLAEPARPPPPAVDGARLSAASPTARPPPGRSRFGAAD